MTRTILVLLALAGVICTFYGFSVESVRVFEVGITLCFLAIGFIAIYALTCSVINSSNRNTER